MEQAREHATEHATEHGTEQATITVTGMKCGSCVRHVTTALERQPGVSAAQVSLAAGAVTVSYESGLTNVAALVQSIRSLGYGASEE